MEQTEKLTVDPLKSQVCDLAGDYVSKEYFPIGERWFVWEEWDDPENDLTAHTASGISIPGDYSGYYQWGEVYRCQIQEAKVTEYKPDTEEYTVKVTASVIILRGDNDDDDDDEPEPEIRIIHCYIEQDEEGKLYVEDAEE